MATLLAKPELLAPAGDLECLRAAVSAGADAVYFGLQTGFNARARANNFTLEALPEVMNELHGHGVEGFVTFNTLVFDSELQSAEETIAAIAAAGVDALIVQDLGIARLAHTICPELPIHSSTQMTVSSAEGAAIAKALGVTRIVLPRELSIEEIARFAAGTDLELECFVHGALCMSWSGQCLTSEALQSRSANRGQCAQSCRLPYALLIDDRVQALGDVKYLLSPKDLAAYALLPELLAAGVSCFKIEGRLKGPEYVANVTDKYRRALDAAIEKRPSPLGQQDALDLRYTFSRDFGPGFLEGSNHQSLVHGKFPGHRGVPLGKVRLIDKLHVYVDGLDLPPLQGGDRVLFDQQRPEEKEPRATLHAVDPTPTGAKLVFGAMDGDELKRVRVGDIVFKSRDAALARELKTIIERPRKLALSLVVEGAAGEPLRIKAKDSIKREAFSESTMALVAAKGRPLTREVLQDKLAFGATPFQLTELDVQLNGELALPPSELKRMRRALSDALVAQSPEKRRRAFSGRFSSAVSSAALTALPARAGLVPLLRTLEQVDATLALAEDLGIQEVILDFMELVGLGQAVDKARAAGLKVIIATPRVQKPGEEAYDRRFEKLAPDGILARHLGALEHFARGHSTTEVYGDFSLNATNAITARTLLGYGLTALTPAYDMNLAQLLDVARGVDAQRLEVTLHQHLPLYHTEHCVYAHLMSQGRDFRDCGRPCEKHTVALREDNGLSHPVLVDIGCRNTVFNARAQSAASCFTELKAAGINRFRVELVRESGKTTRTVLESYAALLAGRRSADRLGEQIGALEKYGVSAGTLTVLQ